MSDTLTQIEEVHGCNPAALPAEVLTSTQPLILRGLVSDWPIVRTAMQGPHAVLDRLRDYYQGRSVSLFLGTAEIEGRFFYNDDMTGFNFLQMEAKLGDVFDKLIEFEHQEQPPAFYVGSTAIDTWLNGFRQENDLGLDTQRPLTSIWIGNQSRVAAHFDSPDNIACCVLGRRRFTVFPPEQVSNLYVGPQDLTPAGQQISMVDFANPDLQTYPKFSEALAAAQVAELEPGDALFLPSMWWHHVEALDAINILVNYWWTAAPAYLGSPADALTHAMLAIKELPPAQRNAWQSLFKEYVFDPPQGGTDHIVAGAKGRLGKITEPMARRLRAELLNRLKQ
ncbi:MAG: cupin-like domain-containing protein [Halioglobus sp.]